MGRHNFTFYITVGSDCLRVGRSGNRISMGARFSATVQSGPGAPSSLLYNGYWVSFSGVKRPGRGVDHTSPSSIEVKQGVEPYLYSPSGPSWLVLWWTFLFPPITVALTISYPNNTTDTRWRHISWSRCYTTRTVNPTLHISSPWISKPRKHPL
jgi:hypothetical protein